MDALVFDMDGVVVNSVGYWNDIREEIIRSELGVEDVDVLELVGMNAYDEYDYLAERNDLLCSKATYASLIEDRADEVYRERVTLFPGLEDVLDLAITNDVTLAIVSASSRERVEAVLDRFELEQYFSITVAGDDVSGPSKPDPAIYEHAVSRLGVEPDGCITVEDSEHGVAAAKGAGVYCIGYAHHAGQPLEHADETFENASRLRERLGELCRVGQC